jgi:hypothetical protein
MNLANPPFDDPNVRIALNYALDKEGFRQLRGGPLFGELAGHIMVNSLQGDQLKDYDPYPTPNGRGDVTAAKAAMAASAYDTDGDGVCDDPSCDGVVTIIDEADPYPKQTALLQQTLEPLGITLDVKTFERTTMYSKCEDPNSTGPCAPACPGATADGFTFGPAVQPDDRTVVLQRPDGQATNAAERSFDPSIPIPSAEDRSTGASPFRRQRLEYWARSTVPDGTWSVGAVPVRQRRGRRLRPGGRLGFDQFAGLRRSTGSRSRSEVNGDRDCGTTWKGPELGSERGSRT